jgi:hypothetical protein
MVPIHRESAKVHRNGYFNHVGGFGQPSAKKPELRRAIMVDLMPAATGFE